jgi:leucyl-tRNA synthetase
LIQDTITMAVQFNGKVRWTVEVALDADQDQVMELVKKDEKMQKYLVWNIVKIIYIAGKICNIVISE